MHVPVYHAVRYLYYHVTGTASSIVEDCLAAFVHCADLRSAYYHFFDAVDVFSFDCNLKRCDASNLVSDVQTSV